jgi:excisionase family DNA binding protein
MSHPCRVSLIFRLVLDLIYWGNSKAKLGLLTVEEVAAIFRLSKFTDYRMVKRKQIPCLLIGGSRRFDPKTLGYWARKKDPMLAAAAREFA